MFSRCSGISQQRRVNVSVVDNFEKYDFLNGTKFLTLVIWLVKEHEVAFWPVCFLNFELFLFIVKELTVPYFHVLLWCSKPSNKRNEKSWHAHNVLVFFVLNKISLTYSVVSEDRRWKEKPGMNRFYRVYSLTCPAHMQIYWNIRKCLYK